MTPGVRFAPDFDALARQDARINPAYIGELDQTIGFDRGHDHADFVHVGGDHDAELRMDRAALDGGDVAQGVDLELGDMLADGVDDDVAHFVFFAADADCV